ncbi:sensor histidine kinase [Enemella dayhoffiae]|nr:histidine kinase [Enemella dayhoffiae]
MPRWSATGARRFELYVRWSLYLMLGWNLVQVLLIDPKKWATPVTVLVVGLLIVSLVLNVKVTNWALARMLNDQQARPRWLLPLWAVALVATTTVVTIWYHGLLLAVVPLILAMASISPILSARMVALFTVVTSGLLGVLALFYDGVQVIGAIFLVWFLVWGFWLTAWMLRVMGEVHQAQAAQAQLALAEERLRISRDLHDVFGRTLATISVKSELAAELARRGRSGEAAAEMSQIREIANGAGSEVRKVVRGERVSSFSEELEGARALLDSAGIDCTVAGGRTEPPAYADTLAWVVREAATNILRHSRASRVTIALAVGSGADTETTLTLTNDGAGGRPATESTGTGLPSMADRLEAVGGRLTVQPEGDWFTVTAAVPSAPRPAKEIR